jgi:hypothetical protein
MGRQKAQPSIPGSILYGSYGKTDTSMKRQEASKMHWRRFGMRVLLLAVTAAVMGTLLLEHMRLRALTAPQQLMQPVRNIQQPSNNAPMTNTNMQQAQQQQRQQQHQVPSHTAAAAAAADPMPVQQHAAAAVGAQQQQQMGAQQEPLPHNRWGYSE